MAKISEMIPNQCGSDPNYSANIPSWMGTGVVARLFSIYQFDDIIRDTLRNDAIVRLSRKRDYALGIAGPGYDKIVSYSLYSQFLNAYMSTRAMYNRMDTIRYQYLVMAALQTIIDDAVAADPRTGDMFTIEINQRNSFSKKCNKLVKTLQERLHIDRVLQSVLPDAIFYGEYAMTLDGKYVYGKPRTQVDGGDDDPDIYKDKEAGIHKIIDSNPPGTLLGIYDNVDPIYFFRIRKGIRLNVESRLERIPPYKVWHITIFPFKIRFSLGYGQFIEDKTNYLANYLRIGQPLFLSTYDKILELEAFEKAQIAKEFGDLKRRGIIKAMAPAGLDLDQLKVFTQYYEKILNESSVQDLSAIQGLDAIGRMVSSLSNVRVLPVQPDRGDMGVLDTRVSDQDAMISRVEDRRRVVLQSIGIPYEYVFGARGDQKINLRQYIRYSRLCRQVQDGVSFSLQRLVRAHLLNVGFNIPLQDIDVNFYNTINIAELDKLEFVDANIALLTNFNRFIDDLAANPQTSKHIDLAEKLRYIDRVFNTAEGMGDIIKIKKDTKIMGDPTAMMGGMMGPSALTAASYPGGGAGGGEPSPGEMPTGGMPTGDGSPSPQYASADTIDYDRLSMYEDTHPILQIINYMKSYFRDRAPDQHKYWINQVTDKWPNVPLPILIDIKDEVTKALGIKVLDIDVNPVKSSPESPIQAVSLEKV